MAKSSKETHDIETSGKGGEKSADCGSSDGNVSSNNVTGKTSEQREGSDATRAEMTGENNHPQDTTEKREDLTDATLNGINKAQAPPRACSETGGVVGESMSVTF